MRTLFDLALGAAIWECLRWYWRNYWFELRPMWEEWRRRHREPS